MSIKKRVKYKKWVLPSLGGDSWSEIDIESCKEFSLEEIELHELRFEFMKRSNYKAWNPKVKKSFDNVSQRSSKAYLDMEFPEWWRRHNLHFSIALYDGLIEVKDNSDYRDFKEMAADPEVNAKIFVLFMDTPVNVAKRQLADILKSHRRMTSRYTTRWEPNGDFPIYGWQSNRYVPDRQMLWNMLAVYDLVMKYRDAGIRRYNWQIEEEISNQRIANGEQPLITRAIRKRKETESQRRGKEEPTEYQWDELSDEKRRVQASTISRYFKQAKMIIANVEQGVFPKWTK